MKVLHSINTLGENQGGPSASTYNLTKSLRELGVDVTLLCYTPKHNEKPIAEDSFIVSLDSPFESRFGVSYSPNQYLKKNITNFDIVHAQGLWQYMPNISTKYALNNSVPYIISTRGMLYENVLKGSIVKNLALSIYQKSLLNKASVVHATCKQEYIFNRKAGVRSPIAIIPNSVEFDINDVVENTKKNQIGFIGRLHPIKNIDLLIKAWNSLGVKTESWELVLIGGGDEDYVNYLKSLAHENSNKNIIFKGFAHGADKQSIMNSFKATVLVSKSENFGMSVVESLALKIPVIASNTTPWDDLEIYNCGWWIDNSISSIANTLDKVFSTSIQELKQMGENGRSLIEKKYSTQAVTKQMVQVYNWILNNEVKPDFVYLD
ncbi:MAG: glycosyltransferase [Bacteroidales bacterium]|nr:glycosyltransferase [Bacteroidales bacterium]